MPRIGIAIPGAAWRFFSGAPERWVGWVVNLAWLAGLALLAVFAGYICALMGEFVAARPAFAIALPLIIVMGFMFALSPKSLVVAVIVLRGAADPVFQNTQLGSLGGLGGMVNLAVIVLLIALLAREPERVPRAAWWVWIPFIAIEFAGLTYSPDTYQALRLVLAQVSTAAMFLLAFYLVDDAGSLVKALRLVVASSFLVVIMTIVAIARGDAASTLEGMETVSGRYGGPFPHPNILAFYLVLLIGILLYLWKRTGSPDGWFSKTAYVLYMLVLVALLYATKTRSAWLAAVLLFLLYGVFVERRYLVYIFAALLAAMAFPEVRDRVYDLTEGNAVTQYGTLNSFAWRKYLWTTGLAWMEPLRFLAGYGDNAFYTYSIDFFPISGGNKWNAHSVFVQMLFELGVIGLACFLWLFIALFRLMLPAVRHDRLMKVVFGTLVGIYVLVSSSDNMLSYLVFNWYFWFTVGAVCAVAAVAPPTAAASAPSGPASRRWRPSAR